MLHRFLIAVAIVLVLPGLGLGEDHAPVVKLVQQQDTFPAALGYAFLGAVTTVGGVLGGVIAKLYFALLKKDEILTAEKDARRIEAERLLREQQTILKEVMVAMAANTAGYQKLSEAVADLSQAVTKLLQLVGEK